MASSSNKKSERIHLPCGDPEGDQVKVLWTVLNNDLGKYHNKFIEEFPKCLFVRVLECGSECTISKVASGGIALIREEVMLANALRKKTSEGTVVVDHESPFLIFEADIIAFGTFPGLDV